MEEGPEPRKMDFAGAGHSNTDDDKQDMTEFRPGWMFDAPYITDYESYYRSRSLFTSLVACLTSHKMSVMSVFSY